MLRPCLACAFRRLETDAQNYGSLDHRAPSNALFLELTPIPAQFGIDHLNKVVAPGHAEIPINSAVNLSNVQQLSGLSPDDFLLGADAAIGAPVPPGFWLWGPFGALSFNVSQRRQLSGNHRSQASPLPIPVAIRLAFNANSATIGSFPLDYYHKGIENILGVRETNLPLRTHR